MTQGDRQRTDTGRHYSGRLIHAAAGVHEHAAKLISEVAPAASMVVEIGAGSGALSQRLTDSGFEVLATDLEPMTTGVTAFDLERDESSVLLAGREPSVVALIETLEHLENPRAGLRALRRLLQPGGHLVLSTPHVSGGYSRLKYLMTGSPLTFGPEHYTGTGHISMMPAWLVRLHLERAGFEVVHTSRAGQTDFTGVRRWLYRLIELVMRPLTRHDPAPRSECVGDGMCLFIVARAV